MADESSEKTRGKGRGRRAGCFQGRRKKREAADGGGVNAGGADEAEDYRPTAAEWDAIEAHRARNGRQVRAPNIRSTSAEGVTSPSFDHPDGAIGAVLAMRATAAASTDFLEGMLLQLVEASGQPDDPDARKANFILSVIEGVAPRDQLETMLAAQMGALQMASMTMAGRLARAQNIAQQDSAARALAKLTRAFGQQVDALSRYRGKGQQVVRVEHVHVHPGGQAIVGAVETGGRGHDEERDQPHARAIEYAPGTPMRCPDTAGDAVPRAGGEREDAMPAARRRGGQRGAERPA